MASVSFEQATRQFPGTDRPALDRLDLRSATASSLFWSGRPGAARRRRCAWWPDWKRWTPARIRIGDRDVTDVDPKDRDVAMVFQNYALYPHMTVAQNMGFALKIAKTAESRNPRTGTGCGEIT